MAETASLPRPSSRWILVLGVGLVAGALLLLPEDRSLGGATRWIFFHGALVWTAILCAVLTALLGAACLFTGPARGDAPGGGVLRLHRRALGLTALLWTASLGLSFPIMGMTWGGILWDEPRLLMSFVLTSAFLAVWGIGLMTGGSRLTGALTVAAGILTVALVASVSSRFHPDSPVLSSGDPRFIGGFAAVVLGLVLAEAAAVMGGGRR